MSKAKASRASFRDFNSTSRDKLCETCGERYAVSGRKQCIDCVAAEGEARGAKKAMKGKPVKKRTPRKW